jgi:hypothetical protein
VLGERFPAELRSQQIVRAIHATTRKEIYRLQRPETRAQVAVAIGTHRKLGHNAAGDLVLAFPFII